MNSKSQLISATCVAALALCGPMTALAASKKAASPTPAASASPAAAASPAMKAPRSIPFRGMVASVDQNAKTFTIAGKEASRTFMVTEKTTVTKAGTAAAMKDLAANDAVRGSYWKQADGKLEARTVKIGAMTDAEKAAAGKKSKKKTKDTGAADVSTAAKASPSPSASPKK